VSLEDRVAALDLRAKVRLLTGATLFTLYGDKTIELAPMAFSDGPTGVRGLEFSGGTLVSLLPNATLLAATWSTGTLREVGEILAEEAQRQQIHVVLGPTINLHRSPLGGRLFEAYSEDPLLTGVLAAAYVDGLQSRGIGACLKHLVGNEAETDRHTVNSRIDERTLRELYLLPFEIAVSDADPWSVMAAYNDVNGVPATEQDGINNGILKGEWGWTGLLMSDWFATKSAAPAANGGLDLVMPGPDGPWGGALAAAVEAGGVPESVVDDHVRRLLQLAERVGALGTARTWPSDLPEPDSGLRRGQLLRLAASGMTVLTNNNDALPLHADGSVALIGRHAVETVCMGGGSAKVRPPHQISIASGLATRLGSRLTVVDGVGVRRRSRAARPEYVTDPVTGTPGVRVKLYAASGALLDDSIAAESVKLIGFGDDLPEPAVRAEFAAIVPAGAMTIGVVGSGDWTLRAGPLSRSFSLTPESSDLAESVLRPVGFQTDVEFSEPTELVAEVAIGGQGAVGLVAEPAHGTDDDAMAVAVGAASAADVAVVVVGLTEEQETEAADKSTLALPGRQDQMVAAVAAAARRTVVVVNAATPVLMPWLDQVDAVLWAGIPGQEGGHAVAAALLNEIEPAGRLVTSIPVADGAAPAWDVVPTDGVLEYAEGVYIGYRGHRAGLAPEPAFWFGHGLGYGSWSYDSAGVDGSVVRVEITNTSANDSREVVQIYYDPQAAEQPVRLVGWATAEVAAGASASVEVRCDRRMWRTWTVSAGAWDELAGGELLVARGLGDIRHRLPIG
jgi:beta-glucosidase